MAYNLGAQGAGVLLQGTLVLINHLNLLVRQYLLSLNGIKVEIDC